MNKEKTMEIIRAIVKGYEYLVTGSSVTVNLSNDRGDTVVVEDLELYRNGNTLESDGVNFTGHHFVKDEIAGDIIRGYLNEDCEVITVSSCDELREVKEELCKEPYILSLYTEGDTSSYRRIFRRYITEFYILDLQMVDKDNFSYYSDGDNCRLIRADGSVATDYESKYGDAFDEAIEKGGWRYLKTE